MIRASLLSRRKVVCTILLLMLSLLLPSVPTSRGQVQAAVTTSITPDGTLGTAVTQVGPTYNITGGTRPGNGPNLFHSFGLFSVGPGDIANFLNQPTFPTTNILGRVTTVGAVSNIFGTIQTTGFGNANLFLINPAGWVFGPTASLNVGGAMSFTTAQYIRLFDGVQSANFYANPASDSLANSVLSLAPVVNFGFLTAAPAAFGFLNPPDPSATIAVQGSALSVNPGQSVTLVGGNISIQPGTLGTGTTQAATLRAPSGHINIASVASAGEVVVGTAPTQPALDVTAFPQLGQVTISGQSLLDASGSITSPGGGTVLIRGGQLMMDHSTMMSNTRGSTNGVSPGIDLTMTGDISIAGNGPFPTSTASTAISATTSGMGRGGDIVITAPSLELTAGAVITAGTTQLPLTAKGPAGNIALNVDSLNLSGLAKIQSQNLSPVGSSQGGNVTVNGAAGAGQPSHSVVMSDGDGSGGNNSSGITSITSGPGPGGQIAIRSDTLTLNNGALILSRAGGRGSGGAVLVEVSDLTIAGGAGISSQTTFSGSGGNITVRGEGGVGTLAELVQISGIHASGATSSGIFSASMTQSNPSNQGVPGDTNLNVATLTLSGGGVIQSGSFFQQGGNVSVNATKQILISNGSSISSQAFVRDVGTLSVSSPVLSLENGLITTSALNSAGASILLQVGQLTLTGGARIDSGTTGVGKAGAVTVQGLGGMGTQADVLTISGTTATGQPSGIFTNTGTASIPRPSGIQVISNSAATGAGGNVSINAKTINLTDGATISAESSALPSTATGGSVTLKADQLHMTNGASITAASTQIQGAAAGGGLNITANSVTMDSSAVSSTSAGTGLGGNIVVSANAVNLNGSTISATANAGNAGVIAIANATTVQGTNSTLTTESNTGAGGSISMSAATAIDLTGTIVSAKVTGGTQPGGSVSLTAPIVNITGGGLSAETGGAGAAGGITLNVGTLTATNGAQISSSSTGTATGNAGSITIQGLASPAELLTITDSSVTTSTAGPGTGGAITMEAAAVNLSNATISASTAGTGNAGSITIKAGSLTMANGADITSSSTGTMTGAGNAGTVTIQGLASPADLLTITDSSVATSTAGPGTGGAITMEAGTINLTNATVSATAAGSGDGGSISLKAGGNFTSDSSTVSTAAKNPAASAKGGAISLSAGQNLLLKNQSQVSTSSAGLGNAGDIKINPDVPGNTFEMQNSSLSTSARFADGGDIGIHVKNMFRMTDSLITSSVGNEQKTTTIGGNIFIDPDFAILQNSQIRANAFAGTGGNITITAGVFLADPNSLVDASSQLGISGSVDIRSPVSNVAGIVGRLPESVLAAQALLRAACAARLAGAQISSFVERGRDSIPSGPDGLLAGPFLRPSSQPSIRGSSLLGSGSGDGAGFFWKSSSQERRLLTVDPIPLVHLLPNEAACGS